jgi:hypothetical protein
LVNNRLKWCCPHCSQTSSRRGNLKTHIERWHQGTGRPIREDERHSSYTASIATHYIPDMMMGLQNNNNNNPHLNYRSYPHTFSVERRKIEEEGEETSKKRDPITESLEFARKWVEWLRLYAELKNLSNQLWSTTPNFIDQLSVLQQPQQQVLQKTQYTNSNFTSPFGFRVYSCYKCLTNSLHRVLYPTNKEGTTTEDIHECNPQTLGANEYRQNKSDFIKKLNDTSWELLKHGINGSATNRDNYVICIELSDLPKEEEVLQLTNPQNPKTPISFWYKEEKHIELNLDIEDRKNNNNTNQHWAERAIVDGQTKLTEEELSEFLQLVKTATFAFFKIKRKGDLHCYFMAITNVLLRPPTFN